MPQNPSSPPASQRRKSVRYKPEEGTIARLDVSEKVGTFDPDITALVINESYSGCCLVIGMNPLPKEGQFCQVQLGQLAAIRAEVRWRVDLDQDVVKLGLLFLQ